MTPLLHQRHPELAATLPHVSLGTTPTPVRRLEALEPAGTELWIKDDGAFGDGGWGGNKVRKLEWILPEARRRGARTILTVGGLGTNWGLATALYGRDHGVATALLLVDQPVDDHVVAQQERLKASGATLHYTHTKARTVASLPLLMARHSAGGRPPYLQPAGGSSAVGALGYVEAAYEIAGQVEAGELPAPTHVVTTVGSGGTAAGLALGLALAGLDATVIGIVVNDGLRLDTPALTRLAGRTRRLLARRGAAVGDPRLRLQSLDGWMGAGYGHPTAEATEAIADAAASEALTLDPVYTSKTMSAIRAMDLGPGPVLYIHTDGPR
ncbi:MAG TPA: pyridoxal-phosphate dependent enzyme [Thermoleophilaceae bacterium]|nr:pyridoxal-phosphate dependent enzyme [Thermoleophilaceae bacterium]